MIRRGKPAVDSEKTLRSTKYLLIGGGLASHRAARVLSLKDPGAPITLVAKETRLPYDRPPLSKKLWKGKPLCTISRKTKGKRVSGLETRCNQLVLKMSGNREIVADGVVAGVGIAPNVELAQATKRRKVSSTACKTVACAVCCCGTSGSSWMPRAN